jgi:hypothetical protein
MKKQIITLIAIVAILVAAIFAGCVEKDLGAPVSTPTSSPVVTPTQTPLHEPKFSQGDIVQYDTKYLDYATLILDYSPGADSYKMVDIAKVNGIWTYSRYATESWWPRELVEDGLEYHKVDHVDVSKVMSREEYMDGGGYEKEHATPTSTPEILSMNSYIDRGYCYIVGEVKNNLQSNIQYVKLTATFYDAGGKMIGSDFTYAELDILKPNQKSPFEICSYPDKITPDKYKVHLSYDTTGQSPYTGLAILSHSDKIGKSGYHKIIGEVKNKGVRASSYVKLVSTYYNAKGEVIGTDFTFTDPSDIAAGDSAPFEISSYPRKLRPSRYELQVEGN